MHAAGTKITPQKRPFPGGFWGGIRVLGGFWGGSGGVVGPDFWGLGSNTAVLAQNPKKPKKTQFWAVFGGTPKKAKKRVFGVKIRSKSGLVLSLLPIFAKNLSLIRGLGVPKTTLFGTPKPTPKPGFGVPKGSPGPAVRASTLELLQRARIPTPAP